MKAEEVLYRLKPHEKELREAGVKSLSLFGSVARAKRNPSDVDLLAEFAPGMSLFKLSDIHQMLTGYLGTVVDLSDKNGLKEYVRPSALRDEIRVF